MDSLHDLSPAQVAVLGGGSWATALVKILTENEVNIHWWLRSEEDIEHIKTFNHNPRYLSAVEVDPFKVFPHTDIRRCVERSEYVLIGIPSAFVPEVLSHLRPEDLKGKRVISAVKGMIPKEHTLVTQYLEKHFGVLPENQLVIAGPCHAEEVADEKQSYLTIAGNDAQEAEQFAALIEGRYVRSTTNLDIEGVQYCAVLKNITALACGIAHGLNYGDNFHAVLVSNAVQEAKRFLDTAYPKENRDLNASAYLGDLLVTAYSQHSRNRTFGTMIGRGYSVKSAQIEMNMVAEGYYAVNGVHAVNENVNVHMPVVRAVYNILYERISPMIEMRILKDEMS